MNTRLLLKVLFTLAFLGFSTSAIAHACFKDDRPVHRHCIDSPGGTEGQTEYTVALTAGGFRLNPVDITPNKRGSGYNSVHTLDMSRPVTPDDALMWDAVFWECFEVLDYTQIDGIFVSSEWGVTQGGRKQSDMATNIRITFRNAIADNFDWVDIDFLFYTAQSFPRSAFLPDRGKKMVYDLERGHIWADDIINHTSCNSAFELESPARLEICHKFEDGTGCN